MAQKAELSIRCTFEAESRVPCVHSIPDQTAYSTLGATRASSKLQKEHPIGHGTAGLFNSPLHNMGLDLSHNAPRWVRLSRLFAIQ